jgi:alpha-1,3-rhamnosyl/mannosyltransferase
LGDVADLRVRLAVPPFTPPESWLRRYLYAQPWIAGRAVAWRCDIVHGSASDPVLGWPLSRQVVTLHDVAAWTTHRPPPGSPTSRYLSFQRRRFKRLGAVIVLSEDVAGGARTVLGVPPGRIHLVPPGVAGVFSSEATDADALRRRGSGVPDGDYVLWVGLLRARDPRKALDDLVGAVASIGDDAPTLVLAGRDGDEGARVVAAATGRGVRVVTTGFVDDATLASLYRGAAAVALPSRYEGFGLTMLEAMACGAPVVGTTGGNLAALGADATLLVPPGDVASLSQAINAVRRDPRLRQRLQAAGPARAAAFSWRRAAEQTADVYRAVRKASRA